MDNPDKEFHKRQTQFKTLVRTGTSFGFPARQIKQKEIDQWFDKPLASMQGGGMGIELPGNDHQTVRTSFVAYLSEISNDGPALQNWGTFFTECGRAKDEKAWKVAFTDRIDNWSSWFWPKFESHWNEELKRFQGVFNEQHLIRITRITSLAYDELGKEYQVPLVIEDSASQDREQASTPTPPGIVPVQNGVTDPAASEGLAPAGSPKDAQPIGLD